MKSSTLWHHCVKCGHVALHSVFWTWRSFPLHDFKDGGLAMFLSSSLHLEHGIKFVFLTWVFSAGFRAWWWTGLDATRKQSKQTHPFIECQPGSRLSSPMLEKVEGVIPWTQLLLRTKFTLHPGTRCGAFFQHTRSSSSEQYYMNATTHWTETLWPYCSRSAWLSPLGLLGIIPTVRHSTWGLSHKQCSALQTNSKDKAGSCTKHVCTCKWYDWQASFTMMECWNHILLVLAEWHLLHNHIAAR